MRTFTVPIAAVIAGLPLSASAHHFMDGGLPETFAQGFLSGVGHPVIGLDHVAFIIGAGFSLALSKRGTWGIIALIGGSLFGAALHLSGFGLLWDEVGVAISVILIGVVVMAHRPIELPWLSSGLALAGALHGYAYAETIFGAEAAPLGAYLIGFCLVQLGIAASALVIHRRLMAWRDAWARPTSSWLGAAMGVVGIVFLTINMVS